MKQFDANGDGVLTKEEPLRCGYFGRHRWLENPPLSSMIVPAINGYKPPSLGFFSIATFDWRVNGKTMGQYIKIIRETHHRNAVHFDGENAGRSLYSRYPIFRQTPSIFIPESTLVLPGRSWSERKGSLFVGPYPRSNTLIEAVASSAVLLSRHSRVSRWVLYTKYNFCLPSFFI